MSAGRDDMGTDQILAASRVPQWRHESSPSVIVWAVLGLMLGILIMVLIQRWMKRRAGSSAHEHHFDRVRDVCREKGLTVEEERILLRALQAVSEENPEQALLITGVFDTTLANEIVNKAGVQSCERIRDKLFSIRTTERKEEAIGGTYDFNSGQKLRIHFDGIEGTFPCTVINIAEEAFVVALPMSGARHLHPHKGDRVEGFVELGEGLCSFESNVTEVFMGGVFACRISHTEEVQQVHQREATRIAVDKRVIFGHVSATSLSGQISISHLADHLTDHWEGIIRDISIGGCAISTPTQQDFEVGDFVQFTVQLLEDEPASAILGTIVHVKPVPLGSGGGRLIHIQFLGLEDQAQGTITRTVYRKRKDGGDAAV